MLRNISQLEIVVNGKAHRYVTEMDASIDDVMEALFKFLNYAKEIKDNYIAQQQQKAKEESPNEEVLEVG